MEKGKILLIHPSLNTGGAEKIIAFLTNILAEKYEVSLMLLKNKEITLPIDKRVHIITNDCYSELPIIRKEILSGLHALNYMVKCIKSQFLDINPDLVICFDLRIFLALNLAIKGNEKLILFSERADPYANPKYWKIILKKLYKKVGYVVFQTKEAQNFYGEEIEKKSKVIPNPALTRNLDRNSIVGLKRENYIFAAGRFQYRKGFDLLIDAFNQIKDIDSNLHLLIYGDGNEKENLQNKIFKYGLETRISLLPPLPGVVERNRKARLFVIPSRSEGIPNILIEAMIARIPVVASDCSPGGARLLTDNGKVALLADNNSVNSLAKKIEFALKNTPYMEMLAEVAVDSLKRFDSTVIAEEWKNVIEKQINQKK